MEESTKFSKFFKDNRPRKDGSDEVLRFLKAIFDAYGSQIEMALYQAGNQQEQDDAFQDLCEKLIRNRGRILSVPKEKQGTYIMSIVFNRVKNEANKTKRHREHHQGLKRILPKSVEMPSNEVRELVEKVIQNCLSEKHQPIARLYFLQGWKPKEIAKKLNMTPNQVSSNVTKIRKTLKRIFEKLL